MKSMDDNFFNANDRYISLKLPRQKAKEIRLRFIHLLERKGFSISDLAREIGLGRSYLSLIVNVHILPPPKIRQRISIVLEVDGSLLWDPRISWAEFVKNLPEWKK